MHERITLCDVTTSNITWNDKKIQHSTARVIVVETMNSIWMVKKNFRGKTKTKLTCTYIMRYTVGKRPNRAQNKTQYKQKHRDTATRLELNPWRFTTQLYWNLYNALGVLNRLLFSLNYISARMALIKYSLKDLNQFCGRASLALKQTGGNHTQ